jgi:predicted lipoprotein with Yx(FWY)xxD motif
LFATLTVLSLVIALGAYATTVSAAPPYASTPQSSAMLQMTMNSALKENILTDQNGWTLYTFKNDTPGVSNCSGSCATLWPPFIVQQGVTPQAGAGLPSGVKLGTIQRSDGTYQVTYNDMPLYYYSADAKAGDTSGNGALGLWSVVTTTPATAPAAPAAPSSGG